MTAAAFAAIVPDRANAHRSAGAADAFSLRCAFTLALVRTAAAEVVLYYVLCTVHAAIAFTNI